MEKLFEKIARLGAGIKIGVLLGTVAVVVAIFYWGVAGGSSADDARKLEEKKLTASKDALDRTRKLKEQERQTCNQLATDLDKSKKRLKKFEGKLPEEASVSDLIKDVKAKLSGLTFVEYARQAEVREKTIARIPLDVKLAGPFHKLVQFLHEISQLSRIVNVSDVILTEPQVVEGKSELRIGLRVTTFRSIRRGTPRTKEAGATPPGKQPT
jgi:type IV pilus assembly protein PilO